MVKKSQIIFMEGKERALKDLFSRTFGYLAVGYVEDESDNGFEDPLENDEITKTGFNELGDANNYSRVPLELYTADSVERDTSTGKVLVKFSATLDESNIQDPQSINQIAIVDSSNLSEQNIYSATTFPKFTKTSNSSITFVIGFRL